MYIPKSKIATGLYTNGGEYRLNGEPYVGSYHLLYNGRAYTGANQNDGTPVLLTKEGDPVVTVRSNDVVLPFERDKSTDGYTNAAILDAPTSVQAPLQYYPKPKKEDIKVGEFTRYFLKRVNDGRFMEVNQATYESIVGKDNRYAWALWIPVKLPWTIKGSVEEVGATNRNIVYYKEQRENVVGLSLFLRNNFTQFLQ